MILEDAWWAREPRCESCRFWGHQHDLRPSGLWGHCRMHSAFLKGRLHYRATQASASCEYWEKRGDWAYPVTELKEIA
jgi:hypothetical protein